VAPAEPDEVAIRVDMVALSFAVGVIAGPTTSIPAPRHSPAGCLDTGSDVAGNEPGVLCYRG